MSDVRIISTINDVNVSSTEHKLIITDNNTGTTVNVTPTNTGTITVASPGPKGDKGEQSYTTKDDLSVKTLFTATNITASGDISASGTISASRMAATTGSFPHIITLGSTIEFVAPDGKTRIGALRYDTTDGLQTQDASDKPQRMKVGRLYIAHPDEDGRINMIKGSITASVAVSASLLKSANCIVSNNLTADNASITETLEAANVNATTAAGYYITGTQVMKTTTGILHVGAANADMSMSADNITIYTKNAGSDPKGRIRFNSHKNRIELDGHITASGHISGAQSIATVGSVTATTIQGSTLRTDSGNFIASGKQVILGTPEQRGQDLIVYGAIKAKGSDITMMSGSISMSGDLIATGSVTAATGSFGSGTTTITDYIHSTGNISGSSVATSGVITAVGNITSNATVNAVSVDASSDVTAPTLQTDSRNFVASGKKVTLGTPEARGQDLVVYGAIKVRGSDITLMSGSISASGDLIMTGSISASGDIFAGAGSTGSFDHIITTNNTIEFRNHKNRDEVLGMAKFDPIEGLIAHSASYADHRRGPQVLPNALVQMPKIANIIKKTNGKLSKIGGTEFDNTSDITPMNHMGSNTYIRLLPNDFGISSQQNVLRGAFYTSSLALIDNNFGLRPVNQDLEAQTFNTTFQLPIGSAFGSVRIYSNHAKTTCRFTRIELGKNGWLRSAILRQAKPSGNPDWGATHINSLSGTALEPQAQLKPILTTTNMIYEVQVKLASASHTLQQIIVGYTY